MATRADTNLQTVNQPSENQTPGPISPETLGQWPTGPFSRDVRPCLECQSASFSNKLNLRPHDDLLYRRSGLNSAAPLAAPEHSLRSGTPTGKTQHPDGAVLGDTHVRKRYRR